MYVRKSDLKFIVDDNSPYNSIDGTKYPANWDKNKINELAKVNETQSPKDCIILGFHIDKGFNQVWETREKTSEEISQQKRQSLLNDIISLEAQVTPRRRDEAMLSGDYSFIADIRKQIEAKRNELPVQPEYPEGS